MLVCVMEPDLTLMTLILTFPTNFHFAGSPLGAWSCVSLGPWSTHLSGLPTLIGMHHGQISAVPPLPCATKPYRTAPNTLQLQHTHSTILCHRIRAQSAQPGSHYQAHYVQWPQHTTQYAPAGLSSISPGRRVAAEHTFLSPMITLRSNLL